MLSAFCRVVVLAAVVGLGVACSSNDPAPTPFPTSAPTSRLATVDTTSGIGSTAVAANPTLPPAHTPTNTIPPDLYTATPTRTPRAGSISTREPDPTRIPPTAPTGVQGQVVNVIDGDTIDVSIDGAVFRVRYIGVNTPERDEPCYAEATAANRALVEDRTVMLVQDISDTDQYGRLLRYVYVGGTFVESSLVQNGFAEAVRYRPDDTHFQTMVALEREAAAAGYGCHPTGIFDDDTFER